MKSAFVDIGEMFWILVFSAALCYVEGHQGTRYQQSRFTTSLGSPRRPYSKVVVHRQTATWTDALELCEKQQSSLLCYTQDKHVSQLSAELTFFGFPRMWIRNRNCSDPTSEPNLSVDLKDINVTNGNGKYLTHHKFRTETEEDKLPFICFTNVSGYEAQASLQFNSTPLQSASEDFCTDHRYFLVDEETSWGDAKANCEKKGGMLACLRENDDGFGKELICLGSLFPKPVDECGKNECMAYLWYRGTSCGESDEVMNGFLEISYEFGSPPAINNNFELNTKRRGLCEFEKTCSKVDAPVNGKIDGKCEGAKKNDVCTVSCEAGFETTSPGTLKCKENGRWDIATPACKATERTCPKVDHPAHGRSEGKCDGTAKLGEECNIICDIGFELTGPGKVTCTEDGTWYPTIPSCKSTAKRTCPKVDQPTNGRTEGKCDGTAKPGEECNIICNTGFELTGPGKVTCKEGAVWDAPFPSCKSITSSPTTSSESSSWMTTTKGLYPCCEGKFFREIEWPEICQPGPVEMSCPDQRNNNKARWYCNIKGEWEPATPDLGDCTSSAIQDIISRVNVSNIPEALELLQKESPKYGGDILQLGGKLSDVISNLPNILDSHDPATKKAFIANITNEVADLGDSLLKNQDVWIDLPGDKRVRAASNLLKDEEKAAFQYAYNLEDENVKTIKRNVFAMQVMKDKFGEYKNKSLTLPRWTEGDSFEDSSIFVLPQGFEDSFTNDGKNSFVVLVKYTDLKNILVNESTGNSTSSVVNSPVICVSVNDVGNQTKLKAKTRFVFRHSNSTANKTICSFWNTQKFTWDTEGCEYVNHNATFTECACDHLTSFAILMDIHGTLDDLSDSDLHALKIITQVGCIISIIFLTAAIVVTSIYRALWSIRNSVHRNLCLCLLLAEVIFISGGSSTENRVLCSVIAGFLHYFFLGAFCWMFLEAVVIYLLLYKVFSPKKSYTKRFYLSGYGVPLLVVAISAASRPEGYGTDTFCWLSIENGLRWSFVGPAALILSVNFVALVYALWVAVRTNKNVNPKTGNPVSRTWILGALTLVPLLGSTWILGFLMLRNDRAFVYSFTILNSLQGFAIFVVQCLLNQSSRKCLMKSFGKYTHLIPMGSSSSSTLRSTVQLDTRRRSTNAGNETRTEPTTPRPQTKPPILNKIHSRQRMIPQEQASQKKSRNFGRAFLRRFSPKSRSVDLSPASYTNSSEVCYSSSVDNNKSVVLQSAQHDQTCI